MIKVFASKIRHKLQAGRSPIPAVLSDELYKKVHAVTPFVEGRTELFGLPFAFSDSTGFIHSLKEIFIDEVYRFETTNGSPRIVDAGANIGLSVLYFKRLFPTATIVAYEPDPQMFKLLKENVGVLPGVDLRNAAAWISDSTLTFYSEGSLAGSSEVDFLNEGRSITVQAERLRDELAKGPVEFLKIDIEGAENSVIFDIEAELGMVQYLFFEYHSVKEKPQQLGKMLNLVTAKGFRYFINGAHTAAHPFTETMEKGFDLQLNISCVRVI